MGSERNETEREIGDCRLRLRRSSEAHCFVDFEASNRGREKERQGKSGAQVSHSHSQPCLTLIITAFGSPLSNIFPELRLKLLGSGVLSVFSSFGFLFLSTIFFF